MLDRRTKIVCTLGPAVASEDAILRLVQDGMNVARLNFSHGDHSDHEQNYHWVRSATDATGRAVGILADLQGDRKSTRLNSSHVAISYAVFCLKQKIMSG